MRRFLLALFFLATACSNQQESQIGHKRFIEGDYWLISTLEPHSLSEAEIIVVNNFECRSCAGLEAKMLTVKEKYRDRIHLDYYDLISPNTELASIANYLMKNDPRAQELREYLYKSLASVKSSPPSIAALSARFNLDPASFRNPSILREVKRRDRFARHIADSTPTLIIQGQIAMHGDVGRLTHVLDQLLLKEMN